MIVEGAGSMVQESSCLSYFGGFTRPPTSAETQRYMRGWCPYFALALHKTFGYDLLGCYGHITTRRPDGKFVDVRGIMNEPQVQSGINKEFVPMTIDEVMEELETGEWKCGFFLDGDLTKAIRVAKALIGKNKNGSADNAPP